MDKRKQAFSLHTPFPDRWGFEPSIDYQLLPGRKSGVFTDVYKFAQGKKSDAIFAGGRCKCSTEHIRLIYCRNSCEFCLPSAHVFSAGTPDNQYESLRQFLSARIAPLDSGDLNAKAAAST